MDILQLYKSLTVLDKTRYTPENRYKLGLPKEVESTADLGENKRLILPDHYRESITEKAALIILIDNAGPDLFEHNKDQTKIIGFGDMQVLRKVELFKLNKEEKHYSVFLDYLSNQTVLGMPHREDHKIGELRIGNPVRVLINGKSDFTLTGRKQRSFYEYDMVLEWIGEASRLEFSPLSACRFKKNIPLESCRVVDERKLFR